MIHLRLPVAILLLLLLTNHLAFAQGGPSLPPRNLESVADINDYWIDGVTESWAEAIENAIADERIQYVYFPGGPGNGEGDGSYLFTRPFTFSSGGLTFFGDGTIIRGFYPDDSPNPEEAGTQLQSVFQFGASGASGGDILDLRSITIHGLSFDTNGFVEFGSLIRWNSDDNIENVLLEELSFFDSTGALHGAELPAGSNGDDWSINLGGLGRLTDVHIRSCIHGSTAIQRDFSRHQFLAGGYKQLDSQEWALIDGLYIYDNLIDNGSRSIAISVNANRDSYVELRDVHIYNNVIVNPWRWAISSGFDAAESSDGSPRSMLIDGMNIWGNFIEWNRAGDTYSSMQSTAGIRLQIGDGEQNDFRNINIQGNTVLNQSHESKSINGVSIAGGITDRPLQVQVANNVMPGLTVENVNHSNILVSNNRSQTFDGPPAVVDLGAHDFDRINDVPNLTRLVKLQPSGLDIRFRLFVPEHDERSYLLYSDEGNYLLLKSDTDRSLQIRMDGVVKTLITSNRLEENKFYEVRIIGAPNAGAAELRAYYRLQGSLDEFQPGAAAHLFNAEFFPIRTIGAGILDGPFLETSLPFQGLIWDIKLQDGIQDPVILTGTNQNPQFGPWQDLVGTGDNRVDGILTPLSPYDFGEQRDIPVPKLSIEQNLDGLDLRLRFYTTNLVDEPYLFYGSDGDYLQLLASGKVACQLAGIPIRLQLSSTIKEYQSHQLRIRDTADGENEVRLRGYLDGQVYSFNPNSSDGLPAELILQFDSVGGRIGSAENRLRGAIWDIEFSNGNTDPENVSYQGAVRYQPAPWRDIDHSGNIFTRNDAIPTPHDPFLFRKIVIPRLSNPDTSVSVPWQKLDVSFKIKINDLSDNAYLFYQGTQHNLELVGGLGPDENEGRIRYRVGDLMFPISYTWFEEGGTYDVRIFSEEGAFKITVNGTPAGAEIPIPNAHPNPVFRFSSIGGRVVDGIGSRLFEGSLWDVSIRSVDEEQPIAFFPGDYQGNEQYPWTDLSGNEHNMVNIKILQ